MKEYYFTQQSIDKKSLKMLEILEKYLNVPELKKFNKIDLVPEKSALLVLDMQNFFLDKSLHAFVPSALAIIPKINSLIDLYKSKNLPVIFTKHINTNADAFMMNTWWRDIITEDNLLSQISSHFDVTGANIIRKTQYDAFYNTPLEDILKKCNVSMLVVTGVMTHLCCETTIRSAFVRGFNTFFPVDGTATYNEDFHRASFLNLSHGFTIPVSVDEIKNVLL